MLSSDPDPPPDPPTPAAPPRQRKWHPRVFTGCVNCRRRHVKCDERTPSCTNCSRLSLPCNFDRRFVFKAVRPPGSHPPSSTSSHSSNPPPPPPAGAAAPSSARASGRRRLPTSPASASTSSTDEAVDDIVLRISAPAPSVLVPFVTQDASSSDLGLSSALSPSSASSSSSPASFRIPIPIPDPTVRVQSHETLYYQHFLNTVSTYLIIYDTPSNSNPFRMLPDLVGSSGLLQDTMKALGAMHLASLPETRDKHVHRSAAMKTYGRVVTRLRDLVSSQRRQADLELLATSLLLCMFEKMSSTDASWKIHLLGAGQIFQSMYSPRAALPAAGADRLGVANNLPLRRFLVSLMSYLDVAASCATGEGPLIAGDYWETLGGGWEYNLGVPSFATVRSPADRIMAQLRNSWSRIMSIQTDISRFARLQRAGLDARRREMTRSDLEYRIRTWHESAPDIFVRLEGLDRMPEGVSPAEAETLTAASCIQCYALGSAIYLERVASRRIASAAFDPEIAAAVDRILALVFNFSNGINQLAVLWPLLTAGIAAVDPKHQNLLRERLTAMKNFGFKHVCRVLDTLEYAWTNWRINGGVDYQLFEAMVSSNLVP